MNRRILERLLPSQLPLSEYANDIMNAEDFREYIGSHGYHFTDKLSDYASRNLKNVDGSNHHWTVTQVSSAVGSIPSIHTTGDAAFITNMIYSDYYPIQIKTEADVISAAKSMLHDPDGYDGMFFMRWLSDIIGKSQVINWQEYI